MDQGERELRRDLGPEPGTHDALNANDEGELRDLTAGYRFRPSWCALS